MNRLKFNMKTRPPIVERTDREPCGVCKRQISRYTCPTCNMPYCSLACFKSDGHSECSESFYRKEIETDIKVAPDKSAEERSKMMALLKRFEEEAASEDDELDDELDDESDDLARKLEDVDLDSANTEEMWSLLSPAQQETFFKAMRDPSSELTQTLLASEALHKGFRKPWWESPTLGMDQESEDTSEYGRIPQMMSIQLNVPLSISGQSLLYNILALCLVYVYVTRKLFTSPLSFLDGPDRETARNLFFNISTFITEKKSTLVFGSVDDIVTYMWAKISALSDTPTSESFSALLSDTAKLFKPQVVSLITNDSTPQTPFTLALLAVSDVAELFSNVKHVKHKLTFYAAYLCAQNTEFVKAVTEETHLFAIKMHAAQAIVPQKDYHFGIQHS